ncbi:MAG: amidohydrolase family protein [Actinomycetota bacterium]
MSEPIIDPEREIVDPHHHLWRDFPIDDYLLADLHGDTGSGHRVVQTVFVECGACYRPDGPDHLTPIGETEFVAELATASEATEGATIAGIVARADLRLPLDQLDEVLDAHEAAAGGRFRGIRHALSSAPDPSFLMIPGSAPPDLSSDPDFRRGVAHLGERGLTYDTWHYHHQMGDFVELARAVPGTTIVLDHFGTPLGVGPYEGKHDEIYRPWRNDINAAADCPNVVAKLGGLAMPDNGFGWDPMAPPTSDEVAAAHSRWYHHTIESFGPERCMFESNFPVDKFSMPYDVLVNAQKKMAQRYTDAEQDHMWSGTARSVYGLPSPA